MNQRAVFLDRDGTLVQPCHYPSRPEQLHLFDGLGPSLRLLQQTGFRLIVVTNQAGIAHGYFSEAALERMHTHLAQMLQQLGVRLDAIYHCPHHPEATQPAFARACDCRKPQPGMVLRAARELHLDLSRSWLVGDILDDIEAGNRAGCRTVLVDNGGETMWLPGPFRTPTYVVPETRQALTLIASIERQPAADRRAQPHAARTHQAGAEP